MKTNITIMRRGFTLVELLVVIVIIAALAGLTAPMVIRQRKKADQTEAMSNARQIGLALIEFENEYTTYPDANTATSVANATGTTAVAGDTANDRFRQLFKAGMISSEAVFYAKTGFTKKPDNDITDGKEIEAGENGFGYIMKNDTATGYSSAGSAGRPVAVAPLATALDGTFDIDYYDGKAVVLKMDNSVTALTISTSTKQAQLNGKDLLTRGPDTVWGDVDTPVMANPIPKP